MKEGTLMHFYGTIGPACASAGTLRRLVDAGMTGLRMNLSHGALAEHADWLAMIHAVDIPDLLIDLQGPELRVGRLASPVTLPEGGTVQLGAGGIPCPVQLVQAARPGQQLLLDDGKLLVEVTAAGPDALVCTVLRGGVLQSRKSIAAPGLSVPMPTLTSEDLANLRIAASCGVTGVMLPFVRGKQDILALRQALAEGKRLLLPRVLSRTEMDWVEITALSQLQPRAYGILEAPASLPAFDTAHLGDGALALIPCLAASPDGVRLGRGGGYYDRFLAHYKGRRLLVCPTAALLGDLPCEGWDVRFSPHEILTEKGILL